MSLSHAIMSSLLDRKQSGYDITRYFENNIADFWLASHQQIYRELKALREKGWLECEEFPQTGKPNRIVYQITQPGIEELERWVLQDTPSRKIKDVLLIKLYSLSSSNACHLFREIESKKQERKSKLAWLKRIEERSFQNADELTPGQRGVYLVLSAGIMDAEQFIKWCEKSQSMISAWFGVDVIR